MLRGHLTGTRFGLLLAVVAGVVLGAVLGQPGAGEAASTARPQPKTAPTISGVAEVGVTLVATRGTWKGSPTSFKFSWSRCDANGAACLAIGGATAKIYTPTNSDIGHTLRVNVTARNASGSTTATSAPTAVVPPSGCPPGTGTIPIASLTPPARLTISAASIKPRVSRSTRAIHLRVAITACGGRHVQGASVFATAVPYNQFAVAQAATGADGTVVLTESRQAGFPASRQQRLLAVFIRAWKQGEPETGGVSTSRVAAFRFAHH
jgi:Ig domain of plant-specific actin-binding protein